MREGRRLRGQTATTKPAAKPPPPPGLPPQLPPLPALPPFDYQRISPHALSFEGVDGQLYANGEPFSIKGVNWYGSEGRVDGPGPPGGLDVHSISWYMAFLAKNGFNAIRLLFNHEQVLSGARLASGEDIDWGKAPELSGK